MEHAVLSTKKKKTFHIGWVQGICLTLTLALTAKVLGGFPFLSILGQLVIAILLGIAWRAIMGVPDTAKVGISFAGKTLLRVGIILLGMRLNLINILNAGPKVLAIAAISIFFAIFSVYWLANLFKVEKRLGLLTALGTAICGAAAVAAIAPLLKSKDEETVIGVATVAILGTLFTVAYTLLYPVLGLSDASFGIFAGATLHEVAHVIAATASVSTVSVDMAVIVKLTRVALLIPVAIIIGFFIRRSERSDGENKHFLKNLPVPWFIVGFLTTSAVNTLGVFPQNMAAAVVTVAYFLIAMAMAGLGLNVDVSTFRRWGGKTIASGLIGSALLSIFGFILLKVFNFS